MSARKILKSLAGGACAALVACGGGGGGSAESPAPPSTGGPLAVTGANYVVVAQESLASSALLSDAASLATGAQAAHPQALIGFAQSQSIHIKGWFGQTTPQATGAVYEETGECSSGSYSIAINDANGNGLPEAGDSVSLSYSNCSLGGSVYNGSLSFSIDSLSGSLDGFPHEARMTVGFNHLTVQNSLLTSTANGAVAMHVMAAAENDLSIRLTTAPSFTESSTTGGATYSRQLSGYTVAETLTPAGATAYSSSVTLDGSLSSSALEGRSVSIATQQAFVRNSSDLYPSSGQATATGASGGQVRITVLDHSAVWIEMDANGDGSYEASTTRLWSELV
ncbi:hypothetical protein [Ramlibacter sp. 2FC]|uniref:hypothetical protein n=1 Tax=Ramlibacter sp. 2FC TaxID=2502188 RepID=UPI0010F6AC64|nr:hypothetical protein [Ramlibacter sp. 2FC]